MKTFTAVLLFAAMLGHEFGADAGSFNLSGSFDPGISFGRPTYLGRNQLRNSQDDDDDSFWPQPHRINNFEGPESFSEPIPDEGFDDNENPQSHHRHHHNRTHRH